jgi:hypothetical protein
VKISHTVWLIIIWKTNFLCLLTGVDYTINGSFTCENQQATLSEIKKLYGKIINFNLTIIFRILLIGFLAPFVFSIIALSIREPRIDQQEYSYSMDYQISTNCPSRRAYISLYFLSVEGIKSFSFPFKHNLTCKNLTYGMINHRSKKIIPMFSYRC